MQSGLYGDLGVENGGFGTRRDIYEHHAITYRFFLLLVPLTDVSASETPVCVSMSGVAPSQTI